MRTSWATLALLILTACAAEEPGAGTTTTDSAGVAIASNDSRRPMWAPADRWRLAINPSIQVGNIPGNPEHQLYQVAHSRRLADGGIVVANSGFADVRIFDRMGYHVRTLSLAADSAPPERVYVPASDEVLAYERDGTLALFRGDEPRPTRSKLEQPGDALEDIEPIGEFGDGTLLFHARHPWDETATGVGRRRGRLLHYAPDGTLLGAVGDFDDNAVLFADHGAYIFAPSSAAAAGDSTIWYGDGEHYELRELRRDGSLLRIVRLDRVGAPVLQADKTAYMSAVTRQVQGTPREATMPATLDSSVYADTFPVFDRIVVDDLGNVWVRNYQWFDLGSGKGWSVFDPQGRFLGEVTTPSILEVHQIGADFVLGRMADLSGREAVYIFRLEKPGTAPPEGAEPGPADSGAAPRP
jgi:hypothetical protein